MATKANTTAHRYTTSQVAGQGRAMLCRGCGRSLEDSVDGMVVTFGDTLWHVACRCTKCDRHVEHEQTLLLLSDGTPICASCTYICAVCGQVIMDDAIVTGDDSYHAECFNCRSCGTRIEELIFAKRSKGIWCMTCHNERVARSRKHAEAKRNRAMRKEKENALRKSPLTQSESFDNDLTNVTTLDEGVQPVAPSAARPQADSIRGPAASSSSDLTRSFSGQLMSSGLSFGSSPVSSVPHSRAASNSTREIDGEVPSAQDVSGEPLLRPRSTSPISTRRDVSSSQDTSATPIAATPTTAVFPSTSPARSDDLQTARRDGLTAPRSDKAANRRSGFYGATSLPSLDSMAFRKGGADAPLRSPIPLAIPESASGEALAYESESSHGAEGSAASQSAPSIVGSPPTSSNLADLHNSRSFYDQDTLLFLDQITTATTSPSSHPVSRIPTSSSSYPTSIVDVSQNEVEHLSPDIDGRTFDDGTNRALEVQGDVDRRASTPKSEAAAKLRESIRLSREASSGPGMSLDVNLVEMLLVELDSTKKEMQELQAKYSAFRRASRSAFEGFSMAREEYDKELAARRDLESQMEILRQKFTEQALRLASVDKDQRRAEELNRQSRELRSSVVATEKQLSQLRAEVELSTAQIAELASFDKSDSTTGSTDDVTSKELETKLAARLEQVKEAHRREIEALILQRDEIQREVDELRGERDQVAGETAALTIRNAGLTDENAELSRQVEASRRAISQSTLSSPVMNGQQMQLSPSPTTLRSIFSGGGSGGNAAQAPQPPSRANATSPLPSDSDAETTGRFDAHAAAPVSRKFKWGKSSKAESHRPGIGSISQPLKVVHRGASLMSQPSTESNSYMSQPSSNTSMISGGGSSSSARMHAWQQTSILRPVRCEYCGDKMWGLNDLRCSQCGCYSHAKCAPNLTTACLSTSPHHSHHNSSNAPLLTPPLPDDPGPSAANGGVYMFGNDLATQVRTEHRDVPLVVAKCVAAVEAHGMNYEGIYRKTGGMGQTKLITQHFERCQEFDLEDLDKFNDLAAVTSCLKNYFRSLPDPLFTHDLHERFVACAEMPEGEARLDAIEEALSALPEAHYSTAQHLIAHLHRIHLHSHENKMTPANLGVVFGPTLLRSSVASREFSDMGLKAKLVEILIDKYPRLFSKPPTPAKTA